MTTFQRFASESMLVKVAGDYAIIDRLPMRVVGCAKNLRNRYQVVNSDQSYCVVYRTLSAAEQGLATVANLGS